MSAVLPAETDTASGAPPSTAADLWHHFAANKGAVVGLAFVLAVLACALFANLLAPHSPIEQFREALLVPPAWHAEGSWRFPLGTDDIGRDILSRLLHGARLSLTIGAVAVLFSAIPGVVLGLVATRVGWPVSSCLSVSASAAAISATHPVATRTSPVRRHQVGIGDAARPTAFVVAARTSGWASRHCSAWSRSRRSISSSTVQSSSSGCRRVRASCSNHFTVPGAQPMTSAQSSMRRSTK